MLLKRWSTNFTSSRIVSGTQSVILWFTEIWKFTLKCSLPEHLCLDCGALCETLLFFKLQRANGLVEFEDGCFWGYLGFRLGCMWGWFHIQNVSNFELQQFLYENLNIRLVVFLLLQWRWHSIWVTLIGQLRCIAYQHHSSCRVNAMGGVHFGNMGFTH